MYLAMLQWIMNHIHIMELPHRSKILRILGYLNTEKFLPFTAHHTIGHIRIFTLLCGESTTKPSTRVTVNFMITSSNGNIFRVTGPLCGEFTGLRWIPRTKASDAELWRFLWSASKRLSKQSWGWWFETQSRSLWRHCSVMDEIRGCS